MMSGNTGRLFSEFGISIAGAVFFSSIVALTLTPMMCSKILKEKKSNNFLFRISERGFIALNKGYSWILNKSLSFPIIILSIAIAFSAVSYTLYEKVPKEFAPTEDRDIPGEGLTHKLGDRVTISEPLLGELTNTVNFSTDCPKWEFGISSLMENLAYRKLL